MTLEMEIISIAMILFYVVIITYLGIIKPISKLKKAKHNNAGTVENFLTGSKSMPAFIVGMIMVVTMYSGSTFTGKLGFVVKYGMGGLYGVVYVVVGGVVFYYLAEKIWPIGKKYKLATMADTVELRYQSKRMKMLVGGTAAVLNIPWLTLEVTTIGYILHSATSGKISISFGAFLAIAFISVYLIFGGVHSVSSVDTFSALCMMFGSAIVFFYILNVSFDGNISNIWESIANSTESISHATESVGGKIELIGKEYFTLIPGSSATNWQFLLSWTILGVLGFLIWPSNYMQIYLGKNVQEVRKSAIITGIAGLYNIVYVMLGFMVVAVAAFNAEFTIRDPQESLLELVMFLGNPFVYGILTTFMFAVTVGTMDSTILAISGICANDIVNTKAAIDRGDELIGQFSGEKAAEERIRKSAQSKMKSMRGLIVIVAVSAYVLGLMKLPMMLVVAGYVYQWIVQIVPIVAGGLYWEKATKKGAVAGYVCGMTITTISIVIEHIYSISLYKSIFPGVIAVIVNFIIFIIVSKKTYKEGEIPKHIIEDIFGE